MTGRGAHAARRKDVDNMVGVGPSNWEDGEDESEPEAKSSGRKPASLIMRDYVRLMPQVSLKHQANQHAAIIN
jgi:hypothetical protein